MRRPRQIQPGCVYHLISRFVDREWFIQKEQERRDYLELLGRALTASDWRCLAYAIMSNHIHLAMLAGVDKLDSWLRRVHAPFADSMNKSYDRIGPMFVRGPKSLLVEQSGVGSVIAYIHNNPVRANLVETASGSVWTSHRAYLGLTRAPAWLDVQAGLALAGFQDSEAFDHWVANPERQDFEATHDREVANDNVPPQPEPSRAFDVDLLITLAAHELDISVAQLRSRARTSCEVRGREVVVLCAQRAGMNGAEIARALGVSQQAISLMRGRAIGTETIALAHRVLQRLARQ